MKKGLIVQITVFLLLVFLPCSALGFSEFTSEWEKRKELLQKRLQENPEDPENLFFLGIARANLGQGEKALEEFEKTSQLYSREILEEMLVEINGQLRENPGEFVLTNKKAFLLFFLQRHEQAEELFAFLIKKDKNNFWLYNFLSLTQLAQLKVDKAEKNLQQSLDIQSNRYTHALLGQLYWSKGNYVRAWRHFFQTGTLLFQIRRSLDNSGVE